MSRGVPLVTRLACPRAPARRRIRPKPADLHRPVRTAHFLKMIIWLVVRGVIGWAAGEIMRTQQCAARPAPTLEPTRGGKLGAQFITGFYTNQAGTRAYEPCIPSPTISPQAGVMNGIAEKYPCFVAYPAQAPAANQSNYWNWIKATDQKPVSSVRYRTRVRKGRTKVRKGACVRGTTSPLGVEILVFW